MTTSVFASQRSAIDMLKAHWRLYGLEGVMMIVLGVLAIAYPVFATLAVDLYLGWLFLFSGLFALVATFLVRQFPGFWWALVNGAAVRPGWRHADLEARGRRGFSDGSPDRLLRRGGPVSGCCSAQLSGGDPAFVGLATREWHCGSRARRNHHLRVAGNRWLDAGSARRS